ncbi:MAG: C40 family peptidase [Pseudoflavonifractor sp.]|nr:C40 family peptidase [Alloprevotella sp.]MCM1116868.1 C40 family peptidase [Pseudoflavonifractor sp.]
MTIKTCALAAIISLFSGISTIADPNKPTIPESLTQDADIILEEDDVYMPSLSELLGAPVDNLGFISGSEDIEADIVDYAKSFIGARYRRGAKGPSSFDCSGFTSYVFRNFDMRLGASSRDQATQGERVSIADARPGDLVFFSGARAGKTVGHVGIVVSTDPATGSVKFIHAATSRGVRIDSYPDGGYYSRRFHSIRRVIES